MTRGRLALLLGAAAAAASGCGGKSAAPDRQNFRLSASIAFFYGTTLQSPAAVAPYFAIANEARNDLSLVDATNDSVLNAPVLLRPLALPWNDRPALLASAPLGDGTSAAPTPDLLVGVSAGSSVLQVVQTWSAVNAVDSQLDLGADVLGIVAFPPGTTPAGTARLAVALAGQKLALVQYRRATTGGGVVLDTTFATNGVRVHGLGFEATSIAMLPGDGVHLWAATLAPIGAGAVRGVAEVDLSQDVEPWPVRALDARGPTRLVAAARLQERLPGSIASDATAFAGQPSVRRVYAVLDESGCGFQHRIDCGIVTLDPDKVPAAGDDYVPEDWAGWMPYRAPIHVGTRPLALAVTGPPANPPTDGAYLPGAGFMRIALGTSTTVPPFVATTAVGVVAEESGAIDFLDLGRFKEASSTSAPVAAAASATPPVELNRLWLWNASTNDWAQTSDAPSLIQTTPGYAQDERWTVSFQGALPGLASRAAEAGYSASGPWLAVQFGDGTPGAAGRTLSQVARLYHPALGVKVGDIVAIKADALALAGVTGCVGLPPAGIAQDAAAPLPSEFETEITQLLPPSDAAPGGAVVLKVRARASDELASSTVLATPPEWAACWNAFAGALAAPGASLKNLTATFYAGRLLLTGGVLGYAGRPPFPVPPATGLPPPPAPYVLRYRAGSSDTGLPAWAYQDEDALAASCPLADWDGSYPVASSVVTCGGAGCDRDLCEQLVLARKVRRRYHLAEDCAGDATCLGRFPPATFPFPLVNGPALKVQVGRQLITGATTTVAVRNLLTFSFSTSSGVAPLAVGVGGPTGHASGAMAFDRSNWDANTGYRFLVTYPGNQVGDVSPAVSPVSTAVIR